MSAKVVIYCDFSRIFIKLFVFLDDGRILADIRFHLNSFKWVYYEHYRRKIAVPTFHIHQNKFGGLNVFPIFAHKKLNFDRKLRAIGVPFLSCQSMKLKKKFFDGPSYSMALCKYRTVGN